MFPLDGTLLVQGGAVAILAAFVYAILGGRLVPRSVLQDVRTDRETRVAEKAKESADWRAAYVASEDARQVLAAQVDELMVLARTTDQFIRSLHRDSERGAT